jgi:prenyltransferase beta subunit
MLFSALSTLLMCGDDLSRVNKKAVTTALKNLQLPDGSFSPVAGNFIILLNFVI